MIEDIEPTTMKRRVAYAVVVNPQHIIKELKIWLSKQVGQWTWTRRRIYAYLGSTNYRIVSLEMKKEEMVGIWMNFSASSKNHTQLTYQGVEINEFSKILT